MENLEGSGEYPELVLFFSRRNGGEHSVKCWGSFKIAYLSRLRIDLESFLGKVRIWLGAKHGKTRGAVVVNEKTTLVLNLSYDPLLQTFSWILRLLSAPCEAQLSVLLLSPHSDKLLEASSPVSLSLNEGDTYTSHTLTSLEERRVAPWVWPYFFTNSWLQFWRSTEKFLYINNYMCSNCI